MDRYIHINRSITSWYARSADRHKRQIKGQSNTASRFAHHPHCFDFFALDFLVDLSGKVWLLEINLGPNINEGGDAGEITQHVYRSVVYTTLGQLTGERVDEAPELVEVLNKDMGSNIPCFQMPHGSNTIPL